MQPESGPFFPALLTGGHQDLSNRVGEGTCLDFGGGAIQADVSKQDASGTRRKLQFVLFVVFQDRYRRQNSGE